MNAERYNLPEEQGFCVSGQADTFTAGDAMLARAKSVSQQITERVRELLQETESETPDEAIEPSGPVSE